MRVPIFARLQSARGPIIGIIVGLAFVGLGYFLSFMVVSGVAQDAALLDTAFVPDQAAMDSLAAGSDVVLQGTLAGNNELDANGLVAYTIDRLVERPNQSDAGKRHRWEFVESNFTLLAMQIEGGSLLMTAPGVITEITGDAVEVIDTSTELPGTARTFHYAGQSLGTGARRVRGLRNGDVVSVIGARTGSGDLHLRRIHAGDIDSFQAALKAESSGAGIFGYVALGLGVLVIVLSILALFRRRPAAA